MIRFEVDAILHGRRLVVEVEDDIVCGDLIDKICIILNDDKKGMLISTDKQGVLPLGEKLSDMSVISGERLVYVRRGETECYL